MDNISMRLDCDFLYHWYYRTDMGTPGLWTLFKCNVNAVRELYYE